MGFFQTGLGMISAENFSLFAVLVSFKLGLGCHTLLVAPSAQLESIKQVWVW